MPCKASGLFGEICPGGDRCLILGAIRTRILNAKLKKTPVNKDVDFPDYSQCPPQDKIKDGLAELKRLANSQ